MSDEQVELDYNYMAQVALRGVVRDVLAITAELGDTPGEHHFYIEFATTAPGVSIPADLLEAYPERMTIVLQHKFENLLIFEDRFEVTLHFNRVPADLVIPWDAITGFRDPSVEFGLRFETVPVSAPEGDETPADEAAPDEASDADQTSDSGADVVSLDAFRKK